MPTNYTSNYGLSQWVGSDAFVHEDFNADNYAIDEALKGVSDAVKIKSYEHILTAACTASGMQFDVNVSNINFTEYLAVDLYADIDVTAVTETDLFIRLNNVSTNAYKYSPDGGNTKSATNYLAKAVLKTGYSNKPHIRFSAPESAAIIGCFGPAWSPNNLGFTLGISETVKWRDLASINFVIGSGSMPIRSGSKVHLVGIKKELGV